MSTFSNNGPSGVNVVRNAIRGEQSKMSDEHKYSEDDDTPVTYAREGEYVRKDKYMREGVHDCTQKIRNFGKAGCARGSAEPGGMCSVHDKMYTRIWNELTVGCGNRDPRLFGMFRSLGFVSEMQYNAELKRLNAKISSLQNELGDMKRAAGVGKSAADIANERAEKAYMEETRMYIEKEKKELLEKELLEKERDARESCHGEAFRKKEASHVKENEVMRESLAALQSAVAEGQKKSDDAVKKLTEKHEKLAKQCDVDLQDGKRALDALAKKVDEVDAKPAVVVFTSLDELSKLSNIKIMQTKENIAKLRAKRDAADAKEKAECQNAIAFDVKDMYS